MKTIKKLIILACVVVLIISCSQDNTPIATTPAAVAKLVARSDNAVNAATLPQTILDYISTNYPNQTVLTSEIENNGNYEVTLSNNVELIFNSSGAFLGIDNDSNGNDYGDSNIPPANLPQIILDYVATNHPNKTIVDAELENNGHYEVQLNDGTVLVFDANGALLGTGVDQDNVNDDNDSNDNSNNETHIDPATLPSTVLTYISTNYPNETIIQAEVQSNGHYEVTLSNGIELFFDANGNFLNTGNGDDDGDGEGD